MLKVLAISGTRCMIKCAPPTRANVSALQLPVTVLRASAKGGGRGGGGREMPWVLPRLNSIAPSSVLAPSSDALNPEGLSI